MKQRETVPTEPEQRQSAWRSWKLSTKLGVVALVPLLFVFAVAVLALAIADSTTAIVWVVLLLLMALAGTAAIWFVISTQLRGALSVLADSSRSIARTALPDTLTDIRAGRAVPDGVAEVPLRTGDELGEVARALDEVHAEAHEIAVEQSNLRNSYSRMFVNLSRRSQTLVQRQLRLIEQLERDEEDPDHLSTLFQLDHLATRMRRNNENLMVLSGAEPQRGSSQPPISLGDLLRAAVSEIEQYQRVVLQPLPAATVLSYTSGDLVRLLAELLENATSFSAPDTMVSVSTARRADGGLILRITDNGVGMRAEELREANDQLAALDEDQVPTSRRMGLYVVGRLAKRQGVRVHLSVTGDRGTMASVHLPSEVMASLERTDPSPVPHPMPQPDHGEITAETVLPAPAQPYGMPQPRPLDHLDQPTVVVPTQDRGPVVDSPSHAFADTTTMPRDEHGHEQSIDDVVFDDTSVVAEQPSAESAEHAASELVEQPNQGPEHTPIFDSMLSAWFVSPEQAPVSEPAAAQHAVEAEQPHSHALDTESSESAEFDEHDAQRWRFAADEGWQAVEQLSEVEPDSFTEAGLPKRKPRARLLPGTAPSAPAAVASTGPLRDPDAVRSRFASFQRGIHQGRHSSTRTRVDPDAGSGDGHAASPSGSPTVFSSAPPATTPSVPSPAPAGDSFGESSSGSTSGSADAAPGHAWPDNVATETTSVNIAFDPSSTPEHGGASALGMAQSDASEADVRVVGDQVWSFPADDGWQASAAAQQQQESLTEHGLPQRRPRARLVPGAAVGAATRPTVQPARDPDSVRDRFAKFQRGINDARHSVGGSTDGADEHAYQWEDE